MTKKIETKSEEIDEKNRVGEMTAFLLYFGIILVLFYVYLFYLCTCIFNCVHVFI